MTVPTKNIVNVIPFGDLRIRHGYGNRLSPERAAQGYVRGMDGYEVVMGYETQLVYIVKVSDAESEERKSE